jgi:hypothetical protein
MRPNPATFLPQYPLWWPHLDQPLDIDTALQHYLAIALIQRV